MAIVIKRPEPARRKHHTGAKPKSVDALVINEHTRLRVGHLLTLLGVKHSMEIYRRLKAGKLPPPDGKMKNHPYWLIDTIRPYLPDSGKQIQNPPHVGGGQGGNHE